jgi:hypothetical protein
VHGFSQPEATAEFIYRTDSVVSQALDASPFSFIPFGCFGNSAEWFGCPVEGIQIPEIQFNSVEDSSRKDKGEYCEEIEFRSKKCVFCDQSIAADEHSHHLEICGLKALGRIQAPIPSHPPRPNSID